MLLLVTALAGADLGLAQEPIFDDPPLSQIVGPEPDTGTLFQWSGSQPSQDSAEIEPIATDRPDFTEASSTVGQGVLQLESGYTYGFDRSGGESTIDHSYPEMLFRYGFLADWLEMRIAWNYAHQRVSGDRADGAEDLYLGCKLALVPQDGWRPEMALVPQMTVPTGADVFSAEEVLPGVNWLYGWDINEFLSAGGSTQFNRAIDGQESYTEWAQSWTFGYGLTERLGAYTEWFALLPHSAVTAKPEHYFDGGFTYLLTLDVQWDIRAGVGLNDAAQDYFIGTGLSVRYR